MNDLNCATRIRYTSTTERINPKPKLLNDDSMLCTLPRTVDARRPSGSLVSATIFFMRRHDPAEVLLRGRDIDINDAAQLIVVDLSRARCRA